MTRPPDATTDQMVQLSQMPSPVESAPSAEEWSLNDEVVYWIAAIFIALLMGGFAP